MTKISETLKIALRAKSLLAGTIMLVSSQVALAEAPVWDSNGLVLNKGFDRLTTCQIHVDISLSGNTVDSYFDLRKAKRLSIGEADPSCGERAEKMAAKLCRVNNKKSKAADAFRILYGVKAVFINHVPDGTPCTGPNDPQCVDPQLLQFELRTIDANVINGPCPEYVANPAPQ